jgi:hypothetical protein
LSKVCSWRIHQHHAKLLVQELQCMGSNAQEAIWAMLLCQNHTFDWKVMSFSLSHCHSQCPVSVQIAHATFAEPHMVPAMPTTKYDQDILLQRPTVEVWRTIAQFNLCNSCIHFFNIVSAVMCTCRSSNAPSASSMPWQLTFLGSFLQLL